MPPVRTAAIVGAGSWGTAAAVLLGRAGASVQLGCRTVEQAAAVAQQGRNERYLPGVDLPLTVLPTTVAELDLDDVDVVVVAVPSRALPEALDALQGRLREGVGVLLLSKGLVAPDAQLPLDYVQARAGRRPSAVLGGPAHALEAARGQAGLVVASRDQAFAARLTGAFGASGVRCERSDDVVGVQLAGCAKNAAALAVGLELPSVNGAGVAAGRIYGECYALARELDARDHSFAGLAGAGDLVATVLAAHSRNRRAGELLARGATVQDVERELRQTSEALDLMPLLAIAMRTAKVKSPATDELAALVESRRALAPGSPDHEERTRAA